MDVLDFLIPLFLGVLFLWFCVKLVLSLTHYCLDMLSEQKQKQADRSLIITQAAVQNATAEKQLAEARKIETTSKIVNMTSDIIPVNIDQLDIAAAYTVLAQRIDSLIQRFPDKYSLTVKESGQPRLSLLEDKQQEVEDKQFSLVVPSFLELYKLNKIPNDDRLLLGYSHEDEQPIYATQLSLFSTLVGGLPKQGKSSLLRLLCFQMLLKGSKLLLLDKHFGSGSDSLAESLLPFERSLLAKVGNDDNSMSDILSLAYNIADARLKGIDKDRTPITLLVDETTGLLLRSELASQLSNTLAFIAQESRKVNIFCIAAGHQWNSTILPTHVRDSFANKISFRTYKRVAKIMSNSTEFAEISEDLDRYNAVWLDDGGIINSFVVPNATAKDSSDLADMFYSQNTHKNELLVVDTLPTPFHNASMTLPNEDASDVLALNMFVNGRAKQEIFEKAYGVTAKSGNPYIKAVTRFDNILRDKLQRVG